MALTSELIYEFVKATKDETKPASETTVYGTTVEHDGSIWVLFDGASEPTPVSTTTDMKAGERVAVVIKNHAATVTGNISSPAARTARVEEIGTQVSEFEIIVADKVSTNELAATNASIETLKADNVTIKKTLTANEASIKKLEAESITVDKLNATNAEIENLKTTKLDASIADITYASIENLEATNADVHNLEATYAEFEEATVKELSAIDATIKNLDATYATVVALDAEKARIDDLEAGSLTADSAVIKSLQADVADIDTLIFGSASGNVIQTSFSNAVIAQLGNAQIKSAMIDSVSASKINAGDINTNNVRVVSEDGKLLISDETIQISDSTRVRVQIGKDASGDYSINVWDVDGNLMFSEGGITDKAIKDAIIRNDMVSEDANISATKLDISSLFSEMNDSSETLKATRIYFDDKAQTLDVAFTNMTTAVDELSDDVSSQGTSISVIQGQISSKIWQQDIDSALGGVDLSGIEELNTKYSELNQEIDSISATVASHTTQISGKADNSSVTEVRDQVTEIVADINGFKSTVSDTYAKITDLDATNDSIEGIEDRVSISETNIEQNTQAIELRATKTEVEQTLNGYYTKAQADAAIELSTESITSTVSKTYATKTDLASTDTKASNAKTAADNAQADVDDLERRTAIAETKIEQTAEAIELRATKSEVEQALSGYYTKEQADAAIKLSSDSITSTVSATYATKTDLASTDAKASNAQTAADNAQKDVDDLEERTASAETKIEQNAEAIELRATKTELTQKFGDYYTKEETDAAIELSSDSITSTVRSTYATKTDLASTDIKADNAQAAADNAQADIDNLEIGAKNLIRNSNNLIFDDYHFFIDVPNNVLVSADGYILADSNGLYLTTKEA